MLEQIKCSKTNQGKSNMTSGNKYNVSIRYNGKRTSFVFNDNYLNKSKKEDFIYCILMDADAYDYSKDFEDFCREFGYEKIDQYKQARNAFNGCKRQYERLHKMFNEEEIQSIRDELEAIGY